MFFMDWAFIAYSVYVPFLIFIYILENAAIFKHRKNVFSSSFYKIFTVLSIVNILACLVASFTSRLTLYPIVNRFYAGMMEFSPWLTATYCASYYLNCLSEFLGLLMAFNRFTTLYLPITHNKIWQRGLYIGVFFCMSISFVPVWNLFDDMDMFQKVVDHRYEHTWYYLEDISPHPDISIYFNMLIVTVVCNVASFLLYISCILRLLLYSSSRNLTVERNFLLVGFVTMTCSVPYMLAMLFFGLNLSVPGAKMDYDQLTLIAFQYPWLTDLKFLTPAPMLLMTNSSIRRAIKRILRFSRSSIRVHSIASQI